MDFEKAIESISFYRRGKFPTEAVAYISSNKEMFEDKFIEIINSYANNIKLYDQEKDDFFSAALFLGQFQTKKAFPEILALLKSLPHSEEGDQPFGDALTELVPYILAACFDGDLDVTEDLIFSKSSYLFARLAVFGMLEILLCLEKFNIEQVLKFYEKMISELIENKGGDEFIQEIIVELADVSLEKAEALMTEYNISLDEMLSREMDYHRSRKEPNPYYLNSKKWRITKFHDLINNGMGVLKDWSFFSDPEETEHNGSCDHLPGSCSHKPMPVRNEHNLGRNDPCFCGSGKKFKKCCLH